MFELVFTMTNVSVRSNVKMLLINVRKVCELVLHCLIFYINPFYPEATADELQPVPDHFLKSICQH